MIDFQTFFCKTNIFLKNINISCESIDKYSKVCYGRSKSIFGEING